MKRVSCRRVRAFAVCIHLVMSWNLHAQTLYLVTHDAPPRSFLDNGKIVGAAADQVFEIMKRAGIDYKVEIMSWKRASALAEEEVNTCVFNAMHTSERSQKFKWVEPLISEPVVLVRKKGSTMGQPDLEAVKTLSTAVLTQSSSYESAVKNGFKKIQTTASHELSLRKLENNQVDLAITLQSTYREFASKGFNIERVMTMEQVKSALACNLKTSDELIAKLTSALQSMIRDGTQAKILKRYGLD